MEKYCEGLPHRAAAALDASPHNLGNSYGNIEKKNYGNSDKKIMVTATQNKVNDEKKKVMVMATKKKFCKGDKKKDYSNGDQQ